MGSPSRAGDGPAGTPTPRYSLSVNSASVFLASVAIQAIGFIGSLFVYRFLGGNTAGQSLFGTAQFFLLIASTINSLADLRLGAGYQFFLARGRPPRLNTLTYLILRYLLVGGVGLAMFALAPVSFAGATIAPTNYLLEVLAIFLVLPAFWTLETVYQNYQIGIGNSALAQLPPLLEVIVRTPAVIAVAYLAPTLINLAWAYLLGAAAAGLVCLPSLLPLLDRFRLREGSLLLRYSWPLVGALGLATVAASAIPFVVQASLGPALLNQFNLVNGFRILLLIFPSAIMIPLFPYIAALHRKLDYQGIRTGMWTALRYCSMLLVPAIVALSVYRVTVLAIVNYAYLPAAPVLAILVLSAFPASLSMIMGVGLAGIGWRRLELYLTSVQVALLFGVAIGLMPPFGILPPSDGLIGAALAVLVSSTAAFALNSYFTRRLMAVHVFPRSIAFIALSALLSFFAISRVNAFLPLYLRSDAAQLLLGVLVGGTVYFLVLALVGELAKEDVWRVGRSLGLPAPWLAFVARFCWREVPLHVVQPVDVARVPGLTDGSIPDLTISDEEAFAGKGEHPP
ncbi:MAG: polysaccharide biosynthesis C-terminal domain-containing protein [Thermoplasmata archaeon]